MFEEAMRRIRLSAIVLSLILLGLVARGLIDGLTVGIAASGAFIMLSLIALALLWRQGRRLSAEARRRSLKTR
jgi:hypothetical protein